jgi:glycerol-3-phosphate O-acyltransferase/dihydroxyacetone phosphate acyltransferase
MDDPPARMNVVRWLARAAVWLFYRVERVGPAVPPGPVLLVANHPNALLDPPLVWVSAGRDVRFLAKSTLFRMPLLGSIVRGSGAIPVYRRVDAGEDPSRNLEMFAAVEAALAAGSAVCVFPEGISHSSGRLEELRTGAARIALGSASRGVTVSIVAVGLNFDETPAFRSRATIAFGEPFSCDDLLGEHRRNERAAVRVLTDRIGQRIRALIVEADPLTDAQVIDRVERLYRVARKLPGDPAGRLARRRTIADGMVRLRSADPSRYDAIRQELRSYDRDLRRFGLADDMLDREIPVHAAARFAVREGCLAVVVMPLAVLGTVVFALPYLATDIGARGQPYREVQASWKVLGGSVIHTVWMALLATVAAWRFGWMTGLLVGLSLPALGVLTMAAREREASVLDAVRSYLRLHETPPGLRRRFLGRRDRVADLLDEARAWFDRSESGPANSGS